MPSASVKNQTTTAPLPDITGYENIEVFGAREHNLKNIDLLIPRNKLVVVTGISGSGKSSLAFDTIYAEGQRRYLESFSAYARSFIGGMERPDVDKINGLSPVISIEQKTTSRNPRSTVGTLTEIYDFMRLLFARTAEAFSYETGKKMVRQSEEQSIDVILNDYDGQKISILAPLIKGRKGHYRELFVDLAKKGYLKVRVDGSVQDIIPKMQLDRFKVHDIELVVDRLKVDANDRFRLAKSVATAMDQGKGLMLVLNEAEEVRYFSKILMCPDSGIAYDEPAPNSFSFNSPYGWCETCRGLGETKKIEEYDVIPDDKLSVSRGGLAPLGEYRDVWAFKQIAGILKSYSCTLSTPLNKVPREAIDEILYGAKNERTIKSTKYKKDYSTKYEGLITILMRHLEEGDEMATWVQDFVKPKTCEDCEGQRLNKISLHFKIDGKSIADLALMDLSDLESWFTDVESRLTDRQNLIAKEVLKEIRKRTKFLTEVGLTYLTLNRSLRTLSGGESQRIRLATQIGTQLTGVLYIMDEPSIGLHQRDNQRLITALRDLCDLGNTVMVVEHDKDMMLACDHLIDIGPGAGVHGGRVVAQGHPKKLLNDNSTTADFLSGRRTITIPDAPREGSGEKIVLKGCTGHNLKNVTLTIPLSKMVLITGVSGSGKSTLIHETLYPLLSNHINKARREPMPHKKIEGLDLLDKIVEVDQSPIGRTPRSNPATYTGAFTDIRALYANMPESKIRGYKPGRFSFNVKGGRCEDCRGGGRKIVEMDFLPDVYIVCPTCKGRRYNRETLEVRFKGKSISDVLDMTVEQALDFFANQPKIVRRIQTLNDVGLTYITLGQHATTLSGGEAQRIKLSSELSKRDTGKTMYILDEPTTGLHFKDIELLLNILNKLADKGNTVLVIEHNMDVIKVADYIIDLGPEGGQGGGQIICEGTVQDVANCPESHTGRFLKEELAS